MKQIYLLCVFLLCSTAFLNAQIVNIPDANFKHALLNTNCCDFNGDGIMTGNADTNNDGQIQFSEASVILGLRVQNNISSLTGIEAFTNLENLDCFYNNISSLDITQNTQLKIIDASFNPISSIDVSQNLNLELLWFVNCNINNLDITNNTLLKILSIGYNNISGLDMTQNLLLEEISITQNNFTSIDVSQFANLAVLFIGLNNITELNVSNNLNLKDLNIYDNPISTLDVTQNSSLIRLYCGLNEFSSLDITQNPLLASLTIIESDINNLDLSQNVDLGVLVWKNSNVQDINLEQNTNLTRLELQNNQIETLDLSQNINLEYVNCINNQIQNLNVAGLNYLWQLDASINPFSTVDFSQTTELRLLTITNSALTNLDLSSMPNLVNTNLKNNEFLQNINFKTGNNIIFDLPDNEYTPNTGPTFSLGPAVFNTINSPNLETICVDDVTYAATKFTQIDPNVVFVEDCSINGVNYNTITGALTYDENSNGCDATDLKIANQLVKTTNGTNELATFTNSQGLYSIPTTINTYTTSVINLPTYFTLTPSSVVDTFTGYGVTESADFCMNANQSLADLNVRLLPINQARPGFDSAYQLVYENIGTSVVASGSVTFQFDNASQTFVSSTPTENTSSTSSVTFNYMNLQPFEKRTINIILNTFTPPTVNGDDVLNFVASISPSTSDFTPEDNTFNLAQIVVNSFDPNDKQVLQGAEITLDQADEYLDYLIRFQNTGTASAINVVVTDELNAKLNWNTIKPVSSSHNYTTRITNGDFVEFIFDNINLPAQQDDEAGSSGFIAFKIKPKSNVVIGDIITGQAKIYFDFNAPIITNNVSTIIVETLGVEENSVAGDLAIYPNPVTNILNIKVDNGIVLEAISLFSLTGQELLKDKNPEMYMDLSNYASGIYFLKIDTNKGVFNKRIIKN